MGVIDEVLEANQRFAATFHPSHFPPRPRKHLVVLTCMDTRLTIASLGLQVGDAHIVRNAGGLLTPDALRSLIVSHHFLGTREVMIINHTDCGLMKMTEEEMRSHIIKQTGVDPGVPAAFHAFDDVDANVREQLRHFDEHPWIASQMTRRGFVYEVETGRLREVSR